jgi:hypothetical protein
MPGVRRSISMDLIPDLGIGSVRFGMSPAEVVACFPEEQTYEDWMGGNRNDSLLYHGLIFGFDSHDNVGPLAHSRLVEVTIFGREDARLWEQAIGHWSKELVTQHLERNSIPYESQQNGDVMIRPQSLSLSFNELDRLEYVEAWGTGQAPGNR